MPEFSPEDLRYTSERVRDYLLGRVDADALAIVRLYRAARDKVVYRIGEIYAAYLKDDPGVARARLTGSGARIDAAVSEEVNRLAEDVAQASVERIAATQADAIPLLRRDLAAGTAFADLPEGARAVLGELTTSVVGGGTYADRLLHGSEELRQQLFSDVRQSLLGGESFDDLRGRFMKSFGVDKLAEPKGSAYGSVKHYKNEARRQFNRLMGRVADDTGNVRVWFSVLGETTTPGCAARHGMDIEELDGEMPPRHWNCALPDTRVRGVFRSVQRMFYDGIAVRLKTAKGCTLTITPNHPVLTDSGFKFARLLKEGDRVLRRRRDIERGFAVDDEEQLPPTLQQIFDSVGATGTTCRVPLRADDFYSDAVRCDTKVDVVVPRAALVFEPSDRAFHEVEHLPLKKSFARRVMESVFPKSLDSLIDESGRVGLPSSLRPSTRKLSFDYGSVVSASSVEFPFQTLRVAASAKLDAALLEAIRYCRSRETSLSAESVDGSTAAVPRGKSFYRYTEPRVPPSLKARPPYRISPLLTLGVEAGSVFLSPQDAEFLESLVDDVVGGSSLASYLVDGHPGLVESDEVVEVERFYYRGPVFDVESTTGLMIAEDIITKQCRCTVAVMPPDYDPEPFFAQADAWLAERGISRRRARNMEARTLGGYDRTPNGYGSFTEREHVVVLNEAIASSSHAPLLRLGVNSPHRKRRMRRRISAPVAKLGLGMVEDDMPAREADSRRRGALVVTDDEGLVLAVRDSASGPWFLPGGGVEPGEKAADAAVRETREEAGAVCVVIRRLGSIETARTSTEVFLAEMVDRVAPAREPDEAGMEAAFVDSRLLVPDDGRLVRAAAREAEWDPAEHPRQPAGSDKGGEFAPKGVTLDAAVARQVSAGLDAMPPEDAVGPGRHAKILGARYIQYGDVVSDVAGIKREDVKDFRGSWNSSTGSGHSGVLRAAAADLWGGKAYVKQHGDFRAFRDPGEALRVATLWWMGNDPEKAGDLMRRARSFAQAQYALTQEVLGREGVEYLDVYRGFDAPFDPKLGKSGQIRKLGWSEGQAKRVRVGALSSWTVSRAEADSFGSYVIHMRVPRRNVFGTWDTGFGSAAEREVVVAGDDEKFDVRVLRAPRVTAGYSRVAASESEDEEVVDLDEFADPDWLRSAARIELAEGWDPAEHPRVPAGSPEGGQFAPKGTGTTEPVRAEIALRSRRSSATFGEVPREARDAIEVRERSIRGWDHEVCAVVGDDGRGVFEKHGDKDSIEFSPEEARMLHRAAIFTHNHPGGRSLSLDDALLAIESEFREIRAVTSEKIAGPGVAPAPAYTYSIRPPEGRGRFSDEDRDLVASYTIAELGVRMEFERAINDMTMTVAEANRDHQHEVWTRLARHGIVRYERTEGT